MEKNNRLMEENIMSMDGIDWFSESEVSNCCGAPVFNPSDDDTGICRDCGVWCSVEQKEEE